MRRAFIAAILFTALTSEAANISGSRERQSPVVPIIVAPEIANLYAALEPLPTYKQLQMLSQLKDNVRAAVWTYNFQRFLRDHSELTGEQRTVLRQTIALVKVPDYFTYSPAGPSDGRNGELQELIRVQKDRCINAFGTGQLPAVFRRIGNPSEVYVDSSPVQQAQEPIVITSNANCNCDDWYDCSPIWPSMSCHKDIDPWCTPTRGSCGFTGLEACTGLC